MITPNFMNSLEYLGTDNTGNRNFHLRIETDNDFTFAGHGRIIHWLIIKITPEDDVIITYIDYDR